MLLAASRGDHPHHGTAAAWLGQALAAAAAGASFTLMPMVLASVLRLLTSPKVFRQPTPMPNAMAFVDAVLACPGVRLATLGPEWPRLRLLCLEGSLKGNALPDAWLAAAVLQLGEHLVSLDRDFRRLLSRSQLTLLSPDPADPT